MKVIIKRPGEKVGHYEDIENSLEALQKIVGGCIETVEIRWNTVMIINKDGMLDGLEPNFRWGDDTIVGTAVICGCYGDEFTHNPLTLEEWEVLLKWRGKEKCIEIAQLDRIDMVKDTVTGTATAKSYNVPAMQGWICPVCGRGLSPYTSVCPCKNGKGWEITC